jgi:5-methylcytosine-specific restriction endonuclease McrA
VTDLDPMARRACCHCGRTFLVRRYARNQPSACERHRRGNWHHRSSPPLNYNDATYVRNRETLLSGGPLCHWCKVRKATTADHLVGAPQGTHELSNLVPACADCNRLRGASRGGQVTKAKRKRHE